MVLAVFGNDICKITFPNKEIDFMIYGIGTKIVHEENFLISNIFYVGVAI